MALLARAVASDSLASAGPRRCRVQTLWRLLGGVRCAWQAPKVDCYALLGVSRTATNPQIKEAYLKRAKQAHPDLLSRDAGTGTNTTNEAMVKLNLCYEALTRRRAEYDLSRGFGGGGTQSRDAAYTTGGHAPWWKNEAQDEGDPFRDFGFHWEEEVFQRRWSSARRSGAPQGSAFSRSWRQWAETWRYESSDDEEESSHTSRRRRKRRRGRQRWRAASDSEDSSSEDESFVRRGRKKSASNEQSGTSRRARTSQQSAKPEPGATNEGGGSRSWKEPPPALQLTALGRGRVASYWDSVVGTYQRMDDDFNGHPAYLKAGTISHVMFWSQFGDWKLGERLEDDGVCIAFAEDAHGRHPPWARRALWWRVWDPATRRYVSSRVSVVGCTLSDESGTCKENSEEDNDEVPWSRAPFSRWSTADLRRWCGKHDIDLHGCFDREAVLEKVHAAAASANSSGTNSHTAGRAASSARQAEDATSDSDNDEEVPKGKRYRGSNRAASADTDVQVASRVKTDGSYTRKPSLDPRVSLYGNRIEHFHGSEADVLPWLGKFGDKSRLYGIFFGGDYGYGLVWKKHKYWGRATYKPRKEKAWMW